MTTTWSQDLTSAIVAIWQDEATANPTHLRKVYRAQPGSFGETPLAYIGSRSETITHDAGTRTRTTTVEVVLVDGYRDNLQTNDLLDINTDNITDRFDLVANVQKVGSSIINSQGYRDTDIVLEKSDGGSVTYRGRVFLYSAFRLEGRQ